MKMKIAIQRNIIINNPETKPFLADAFYPENETNLPLVIFVHGYKGYKDWGAWDLMAEAFAKNGFYFVKFNFSHNGTTLENPFEFDDLEAFANNNYSKELSDLDVVLNHFIAQKEVNSSSVSIIGHSRGGGISIIKSGEDSRISNLITWASVDTLNRFPKSDAFDEWKWNGVFTTLNGRTKQNMPHYFQFFEDYKTNESRFNVQKAIQNFKGNVLIVHGTNDEAVHHNAAQNLHQFNSHSKLVFIENGGHTFGAKEPWEENVLPQHLEAIVKETTQFIKAKI